MLKNPILSFFFSFYSCQVTKMSGSEVFEALRVGVLVVVGSGCLHVAVKNTKSQLGDTFQVCKVIFIRGAK